MNANWLPIDLYLHDLRIYKYYENSAFSEMSRITYHIKERV